ncbi:MAG: ribosome biogenesis GTPase Der [Firmicutes bacterium]|nr:ribosome biogenesis GTPase Der [Bacillota bacterium]MDY4972072.1 ribosome biogenesis GTPase Der [Erysipelotrichaceae bacterium]MDY5998615.1 ribosome biogenesis GTPase Der [Erysipelotrichaceae bacterium]
MIDGIIAIIGRPNVGKSTIFNRFVEDRVSIVEDTPGVTRDRIYGKCTWLTKQLRVIDTGGIQLEDQPFDKEIKAQVDIAIEESDVIIFIVSGKDGITSDDMYIAKMLQKQKKPVVLAVNKIDDNSKMDNIYEFYNLGLNDPIAVSGIHGIGIGDLLDECIKKLPVKQKDDYEGSIKFAVIGQPNVGKSSLVNAILNEERVIVSNIEGTTRDAIDTPFVYNGQDYVVIDTAGIRKKGKVYENIEKYSVLRALSAIERSDVVLFVIDGEKGIREQDKHVAGYAYEAGKAIIIIYNKWDTVEKDDKTINEVTLKIRNEFTYLSYAPIIFVSAKTKQRVKDIIPMINDVYNYATLRIDTSILNEVIMDAQMQTPAPAINGKRFKILYATQVSTMPPTFVLSVNDPKLLHFSYRRYLENKIREAFGFDGTPIRIIARKKG